AFPLNSSWRQGPGEIENAELKIIVEIIKLSDQAVSYSSICHNTPPLTLINIIILFILLHRLLEPEMKNFKRLYRKRVVDTLILRPNEIKKGVRSIMFTFSYVLSQCGLYM